MSMQNSISPDLEQFIEQEVTSGRFSSREAVISEALRLLKRDQEEAVAGILLGLRDVHSGNLTTSQQAFRQLRTELGIAEDG